MLVYNSIQYSCPDSDCSVQQSIAHVLQRVGGLHLVAVSWNTFISLLSFIINIDINIVRVLTRVK